MGVYLQRIQSLEREENFIFLGYTNDNEALSQDQVQRMFDLPGQIAEKQVELKTPFKQEAKKMQNNLLSNTSNTGRAFSMRNTKS